MGESDQSSRLSKIAQFRAPRLDDSRAPRLLHHVEHLLTVLQAFVSRPDLLDGLLFDQPSDLRVIPRDFFRQQADRLRDAGAQIELDPDGIKSLAQAALRLSDIKKLKIQIETITEAEQLRGLCGELCALFEFSCFLNDILIQQSPNRKLGDQIATKKKENARLLQVLQAMKRLRKAETAQALKKEDENSDLRSQIAALKLEKSERSKKFRQSEAEIQSEVEALKQEMSQLSQKLSECESDNSNLHSLVSSLKQTKSDLMKTLRQNEAESSKFQSQISSLKRDRSEVSKRLREAESKLAVVQSQLSSFEQEKSEISEKLAEMSTLQSQISSLKQDKLQLTKRLREKEADLATLKSEILSLKQDKSTQDFERQIAAAENDKLELSKRLQETESKLSSFKRSNSELLTRLHQQESATSNQLSALKRENTELLTKLRDDESARSEAAESTQSQVFALQQEVSCLATKLQESDLTVDTLRKHLSHLSSRLSKSEASRKRQVASFEAANSELVTRLQSEEAAKLELLRKRHRESKELAQQEIAELRLENDRLTKTISDLNVELERVRSTVRTLSRGKETLKSTPGELHQVVQTKNRLEAEARNLEVENARLKEEVSNWSQEVMKLRKGNLRLSEANTTLRNDVAQLGQRFEDQLSDLRMKNDGLEVELLSLRSSKMDEFGQQENEQRQLSELNVLLQQQVQKLGGENGSLRERVAEMGTRVRQVESNFSRLSFEFRRISEENANLRAAKPDSEQLVSRTQELQNSVDELQKMLQESQTESEFHKQTAQRLAGECEDRRLRVKGLTEKVTVILTDIETQRRGMSEIARENSALKVQQQRLLSENQELRNTVEEQRGSIDKRIRASARERSSIQANLQKANETITDLQKQYSEVCRICEKSQAKCKSLRERCRWLENSSGLKQQFLSLQRAHEDLRKRNLALMDEVAAMKDEQRAFLEFRRALEGAVEQGANGGLGQLVESIRSDHARVVELEKFQRKQGEVELPRSNLPRMDELDREIESLRRSLLVHL
jgi:chromosome segregation ATPase